MIVFDYISTLLMASEIFAAELLFLWKAPRRSYFWMRLISSYVLMMAITFEIQLIYTLVSGHAVSYGEPVSVDISIFKFLFYLVIFAESIVCMFVTFKVSLFTVLMYCAGGYASQHIASNITYLIHYIPDFGTVFHYVWVQIAIEIAIFIFVYVATFALFVYDKEIVPGKAEKMKKRIFFSLFVIFVCVGLSRLTRDNQDRNTISVLAESLYAIISNIFVLLFLNTLTRNDVMEEKVDIMEEMLHREKQQYLQSKENIELINIKVHDLKHQIRRLRQDNSDENFREVERALRIYDSHYKTGNDALDVILTDRSLQCEKNKITLTCACNGKDLNFMEESDIYSLFGNALSNAIESVSGIQDEDKRCISLNVRSNSGLLSIHVENYYQVEIEFENGLPKTKKDQSWHGFGMKSMALIASKYKGSLTSTAVEDIFYLDVILPINNSK
jgi:hypothetical protein